MSKVCLITGASRGIGEAIATEFAREGYELHLIALKSADKLQSLSRQLEEAYGNPVHTYLGDISEHAFIDKVFDNIPRLDICINNAGIALSCLFQDTSPKEWQRVMDVNLNSVYYICKKSVEKMIIDHSGRILNISSMWGDKGAAMEVAYSASKAGLNGLSKALAKELAISDIPVNVISCGLIDTDMNSIYSPEELGEFISSIPANRMGQCSEVARLALLISKAPTYMTGQIIGIDGGL